MPLPRVTGVVWWEMMRSHYQGVYRRARSGESSTGYTRDFLQGPKPISETFRAMFKGAPPPYEPLTYRWPGGSMADGRVYKAADYDRNGRLDIGQWTGTGAPAVWRIGDPAMDPLVTLEGSVELRIPDQANEQWELLEAQHPWLVMVQLDWDPAELHLRAYLRSPPAHLLAASLEYVPEALRNLMKGRGGAVLGKGLPDLWFDVNDLRDPWRLDPEGEDSPPPAPAGASPAQLGTAYRPVDENAVRKPPDPFEIDPNELDRSTRLHAATQNAISAAVVRRGCQPLSPSGEPNFDLAWEEKSGTLVVAEVKSVKATNAERQLRLGLGQVLRYQSLIADSGKVVKAILVLSGPPHDDRWVALCASHGVGLIWMPDLDSMLSDALG
jgi:hypothetical protein